LPFFSSILVNVNLEVVILDLASESVHASMEESLKLTACCKRSLTERARPHLWRKETHTLHIPFDVESGLGRERGRDLLNECYRSVSG
jgi:hypothetical protein